MTQENLNLIMSVFYYMWNRFSEDECLNHIDWKCNPEHIWSKWIEKYNTYHGPNGAIAPFIGDLDNDNREALFNRATALYDGRRNR